MWPQASSHRTQATTRGATKSLARTKKTTLHVFSSSPLFFRPPPHHNADKHAKLLVVPLLNLTYSLMLKFHILTASLLG
jgi:hypothetical protein